MSTITKQSLQAIKTDVLAALAAVEAQHGVKFDFGNGKYSADSAELKFLISATTNDAGEVVDPGQAEFNRYAIYHNIPVEKFGQMFTDRNGRFKIVGYKHKNTKYPVICENTQTGKRFKFPVSTILNATWV